MMLHGKEVTWLTLLCANPEAVANALFFLL